MRWPRNPLRIDVRLSSRLARSTIGPALAQGQVATSNEVALAAALGPVVPNHVEVAVFAFGVRALVNTVLVAGPLLRAMASLTSTVQIIPAFFFVVRREELELALTVAGCATQRSPCAGVLGLGVDRSQSRWVFINDSPCVVTCSCGSAACSPSPSWLASSAPLLRHQH